MGLIMPQHGATAPDNDATTANHLTFGASACAGRCRRPRTSVFLIAALHFTDTVTASVLSATFLMCGLGAGPAQSTGVKGGGRAFAV